MKSPNKLAPALDSRALAVRRITSFPSARWTALLLAASVLLMGCNRETTPPYQTPDMDRTSATDQQPAADFELTDDVRVVARSSNHFGMDLYEHLRQTTGNVFFSPASLTTALSMVYGGAEGQTQQEMADVLHIQLDEPAVHEANAQLIALLNTRRQGATSRMVNRLWGQSDFAFQGAYIESMGQYYGAPLAEVDFRRDYEQARQTINLWVEEQTERLIVDLIPQGVLDEDTRLVLTNAIYFKGQWKEPFSTDMTRDQPFYVTPDAPQDVPMMHHTARWGYAENEDAQLVELPYGDGEFSMVLIVPRELDGLQRVEQQLPQQLSTWLGELREREVRLAMPRFEMSAQFTLGETLQAMGMRRAFTRAAEFGRISTEDRLEITEVVHQAFVRVDEEGTEAAAATGVVMGITSAPADPPPQVRADRPFAFLIRHRESDSVLFFGRLVEP